MLNSHFITKAIESNLTNITVVFKRERAYMHVIADILDTVEIPSITESINLPVEVILNLTESTVNYFFVCCKDDGE